jgi:hypothetical protein
VGADFARGIRQGCGRYRPLCNSAIVLADDSLATLRKDLEREPLAAMYCLLQNGWRGTDHVTFFEPKSEIQ